MIKVIQIRIIGISSSGQHHSSKSSSNLWEPVRQGSQEFIVQWIIELVSKCSVNVEFCQQYKKTFSITPSLSTMCFLVCASEKMDLLKMDDNISLSSFTVLKCQSLFSEQRKLGVQFHLECTYISLTYYDYQQAKEHIQRAQELSGLNINMTGM